MKWKGGKGYLLCIFKNATLVYLVTIIELESIIELMHAAKNSSNLTKTTFIKDRGTCPPGLVCMLKYDK